MVSIFLGLRRKSIEKVARHRTYTDLTIKCRMFLLHSTYDFIVSSVLTIVYFKLRYTSFEITIGISPKYL